MRSPVGGDRACRNSTLVLAGEEAHPGLSGAQGPDCSPMDGKRHCDARLSEMIYCEGPLGNPVPARAIRLLGCGTRTDRLILQKAASAGIWSFVGGRPIRLW